MIDTVTYDKIIIGAGLYGLYAAEFCGKKGQNILVLECDLSAFGRATYINQARVHQGYHYPRSLSTARKSAGYFARFNRDYDFCINREFSKVYAMSNEYSWTSGEQFKKFCQAAEIPCEEIHPSRFFHDGMCDAAFMTREYSYDAMILKGYFAEKLSKLKNVKLLYNTKIVNIEMIEDFYEITLGSGERFRTAFLLNAAYASTNQILDMIGYEKFSIKYELCEIILCKASDKLSEYGFTVMDGPFFSIMPFGRTKMHSLTSVTFTPHNTCYDPLPVFLCQKLNEACGPNFLCNCNQCEAKPETAYRYMSKLAGKYLREEYSFEYEKSLFSMKPILLSSEIDDSRPTVIRVHSKKPVCVSVLSGKINTVYDLDEVLDNEE